MRELVVPTRAREELVAITAEVNSALAEMGAGEGSLFLYSPHTTAGLVVQEGADPTVARDLLLWLSRLVPAGRPEFQHLEGNSDAHIKTALVGNSLLLPVAGGRLRLGTWQEVFLAEFDGPRRRRVWLRLIPG